MTKPPIELLIGITGSIAAYRSPDLVRRLRERGYATTCILTKEAREFITPLTLQVVSGRTAHVDLFSPEGEGVAHTALADRARLIVIAPATANIVAKLAHGLADDLLTCVVLASKAPVLIAPAMNVHMYQHPATRANIATLRRFGHRFVGPEVGGLACGYEAIGHMAEPEAIARAVDQILAPAKAARGIVARRVR